MTYYSKRQLEAFGEPLGDSVTRKESGRIIYGSGGGSGGGSAPAPAPTQSTAYNTNIPEYAKPYVETMLGATQKQLFEMTPGEEGQPSQITGFKPYTPYSADPNAYVAPFSPLQEQAMRSTAQMQQPGQFGAATGLAGVSGVGGLGIAGQAAGAGRQYERMATTPSSMQAYMSPYMQNVVDYQKAQALRDYGIATPMRAAQAVGQGAFGGSRQAIQESEAQRNLMSQLLGIEATGAQQAFQNAQQAQQFRANLGLQGYQTALGGLGQATSAAGQLGQLGTSQQTADIARLQQQQQMGSLQQQQEQQKINQAIQNYAIQQQYPLMQLGFMSNMLRGLPLQSQTTQLYQAQPTTTQQTIGLMGAGMSLFGKKEGGTVKEYREGGIASAGPGYKYGTLISSPKLESMAGNLSVPELQERLKDPQLTDEERRIFQAALQEALQTEGRRTEARMAGIAAAGGPAFATQGMAGGGIVAFNGEEDSLVMLNPEFGGGEQSIDVRKPMTVDELFKQYPGLEGKVGIAQIDDYTSGRSAPPAWAKAPEPKPVSAVAAKPETKPEAKPSAAKVETGRGDDRSVPAIGKGLTLEEALAERKALGPKGELGADLEKFISERLGASGERLSRDERMAMAKGFLKFASTPAPGGIMQAAAAGLGEYATGVEAARKTQDTMELEAQKMRADLEKARRAEARGDMDAAQKAVDSAQNRELKIAEMQNQIKVANIQASRSSDFERQYEAFKQDPAKFAEFRKSLTSQDETARLNAYIKADTALASDTKYLQLSNSKKPEDQQKAAQMRKDKIAEYMGALGVSSTPAAPAAPQTNPDGTVTIPGKGTFKQLPNGNYVKV